MSKDSELGHFESLGKFKKPRFLSIENDLGIFESFRLKIPFDRECPNTLEQQRQKSTYVQRAFISNYKPVILASYQTRLETG
jgi:hypothetical protein